MSQQFDGTILVADDDFEVRDYFQAALQSQGFSVQLAEDGEDALRQLGFRQFRVRHHGDIARIEIARDEMARAMTTEMAAEFSRIFKNIGFKFVTLDLEGFRSGSMNALLTPEQIGRAG